MSSIRCFRCGNSVESELIMEGQHDGVRGESWSEWACENRTACRERRAPIDIRNHVIGTFNRVAMAIPRLIKDLKKERSDLAEVRELAKKYSIDLPNGGNINER